MSCFLTFVIRLSFGTSILRLIKRKYNEEEKWHIRMANIPIRKTSMHNCILYNSQCCPNAYCVRIKFQISITTFGVKGFVRFPICRCWQVCLGLIRRWTNDILYIKLTVPLYRILTLPDTWSRPFGTCICSTCWDQSFFRTCRYFPDYALRISLDTFLILHNNQWLVSFPSQVSQLVQKYITNLWDN